MARMFCTLKEAAAWLNTTEPELKTMLAEGILPEFRDGANRLLRITDVRTLVATRLPDNLEQERRDRKHQPKICQRTTITGRKRHTCRTSGSPGPAPPCSTRRPVRPGL